MNKTNYKTYDDFLKDSGEKHWQKKWEKDGLYKADDSSKKEKQYLLVEFPYPSGAGLHVGHARSYTALDIMARKLRMQNYNVMYPIGWDAFGLPTENYAIKNKIHPRQATEENIVIFKRQLKALGLSFDWSREVNTTDPEYYKWTQWIFLQLYKKGLAYKKEMAINWCPSCKIGLAHEEVVDGKCERCGAEVEQRDKEQWMLAITKYADRLIKDLDTVDYLDKIKTQQVNWIGKSEGAELKFKVRSKKLEKKQWITVFTTRPDTLFGATYMVLAPEHELVQKLKDEIKNWSEIEKYIKEVNKKNDLQRVSLEKDKTGVELKGVKAINPANNEEIPIFIADYVLASYGTGAIMAVPAHDERDYEFAKKFNIEIIEVISGGDINKESYIGNGKIINSGEFDGMDSEKAKQKITQKVGGKITTQYKLRDWIFSRQHYWGEPIPMVSCEKCGWVPVQEKDLPVELPDVKNYEPTDTGESPLATITDWVNTKCPGCGENAKRETDTMPNWAGSSWYFLRYCDPQNNKEFASAEKLKQWMPVNLYNGGMEHTTLHLLYSRFWNKFLYDQKLVPISEPYVKRVSHGMVLAEDGKKMSKSLNNIISPDEVVNNIGADSLRLYEMFMGPFAETIPWSTEGVKGVRRFLEKIWALQENPASGIDKKTKKQKNNTTLHKTIKKVTEDIDNMKFNTAVSAMMIFVNEAQKERINKEDFKIFLIILAPFAPHLCEELWSKLDSSSAEATADKNKESIFLQPWPKYDKKLVKDETIQLVVQVNGKVRDNIEAPAGISETEAKKEALASEKVQKWTENKKVVKIIFIKGRLINIVIK
ncbi:MAG: leucine--tRNA ligase [Patescibacteria group bacterium]